MKRGEYFQNKYAEQAAQEEEEMLAAVEAELAKRDKPRKTPRKKSVDKEA